MSRGTSPRMASSIVRVVRDDHERIPRLVRRVVAPGPSRQRWRHELLRLLRAHLVAERATLTPAVFAPVGDAVQDAAARLAGPDRALDDAADALEADDLDSPGLAENGDRLLALLAQHEVLVDEVLRPLDQAVTRTRVRALGADYTRARNSALQEHGADGPTPRRLDLPRAELYELARRAGIEGRSAMSRRELITRLQQVQQGERR